MSDDRPTMKDVSHAHPDHDTAVWHCFHRGPTVAADGGDADDPRSRTGRQLRDVSHTPADGAGTNRIWERGGERAATDRP